MATKINQKEYLKKYLSRDKKSKKKKDIKNPKVKIIDEDEVNNIQMDINEELLYMDEDAPQIVGIIEEGPPDKVESKWKSIGDKIQTTPRMPIRELNKTEKSNRGDVESRSAQRWSPERTQKRKKSVDLSPKRNRSKDFSPNRKHMDSDHSPPRKQSTNANKNKDRHQSPRRRYQESPPRKSNTSRGNSQSHSSDKHSKEKSNRLTDISPPRRDHKNEMISPRDACSPQRKSKDKTIDIDSSNKANQNPFREVKQASGKLRKPSRFTDCSPPKTIKIETFSPVKETSQNIPQKSVSNRRSTDLSPKRRNPVQSTSFGQTDSPRDVDNSPKRRPHRNPFKDYSPPRNEEKSQRMSKTLDGKTAGLQDAKTLKAESVMLRAKEDLEFNRLSSKFSGRDAEIQVRKSRAYKNRHVDEFDEEAERQKDEREKQKQEIYSRWGKGLKQIEAYDDKIANESHESAKPLARYSNDADLDNMLKRQERDGDPMLEYIRKKEKENTKNKGNEFDIPKFQGSYPENRFNIRPGYRWDRLDRSNGYEKRWFDAQNQKKAMQEEAYKYSTEDL